MGKIRHNYEVFEIATNFFMTPNNAKTKNPNIKSVNFGQELDRVLKPGQDYLGNIKLFKQLFGLPRNQFMAVKYVLATSRLKGIDRLVAATIAGFYNSSLGYSYPNQSQIATICEISERTVNNAINQMKTLGEWLVIPQVITPYEKAISNRYYLLPPAGYGTVASNLTGKTKNVSALMEDQTKLDQVNSQISGAFAPLIKINIDCEIPILDKPIKAYQRDDETNSYIRQETHIEIVAGHYKPIPRFIEFIDRTGSSDKTPSSAGRLILNNDLQGKAQPSNKFGGYRDFVRLMKSESM